MTDAELAILSLLAEGPSYDHDLNTIIDKRGLRRWTAIGNSSMYYVLDKLHKQGLIELLSDSHEHRQYQISPAGTGVLQTAVVDLLGTSHSHERSFELGLANLHILKPSQIRTALYNRRQDMGLKLDRLRLERDKTENTFQIVSLFDHHIAMMEAELIWLDEFTVAWEAQAPAEPEQVIEPSQPSRMKQVILPQDPDSVHKHSTKNAPPPYNRTTPPAMRTIPPTPRAKDSDKS